MPAEFPETWLTISRFGGEELEFASRVKGRTGSSFELGLVIESIDVAQTTRAENLDDPLGPGREMGPVADAGDAESIEDRANPPKPPAAFCRKSRLVAEALLILARIRFSDNGNPSPKLCVKG